MVSLYARVLHCLLLMSKHLTLQNYACTVVSFNTLCDHAALLYDTYTDTDRVQLLQEQHALETYYHSQNSPNHDLPKTTSHVPISDIVFENAILFLHDMLLTHEFLDTIKAGNSGHIIPILKL